MADNRRHTAGPATDTQEFRCTIFAGVQNNIATPPTWFDLRMAGLRLRHVSLN
jgi:hypothetical protein